MNPNKPNRSSELQTFKRKKRVKLTLLASLLCFTLAGMILFNLSIVKISGQSMETNYHDGEYVIRDVFTKKFNYKDVVTIERKADSNHNKDYTLIKRIIATPNQKITIDSSGVSINDKTLNESGYITNRPTYNVFYYDPTQVTVDKDTNQPKLVHKNSPDEFYVLGDNRDNSRDSRFLGAVPSKAISGKILFSTSIVAVTLIKVLFAVIYICLGYLAVSIFKRKFEAPKYNKNN